MAAVAPKLPAATIAKWLRDPNVQPSRIGLYGSLLGQCGNAKEHGPLLREMLEDPKKKFSSGIDGMLAGYVELDPKSGWKYVRELIADEKQEFLVRYAALRAARYFYDYRKDLISANDVVGALELLLDQGDIADLPIEDLRKWGRWEMTEKIISLYGRKSHTIPIVKRAIIRFALSAPANNAAAAAFLKEPARAERPGTRQGHRATARTGANAAAETGRREVIQKVQSVRERACLFGAYLLPWSCSWPMPKQDALARFAAPISARNRLSDSPRGRRNSLSSARSSIRGWPATQV